MSSSSSASTAGNGNGNGATSTAGATAPAHRDVVQNTEFVLLRDLEGDSKIFQLMKDSKIRLFKNPPIAVDQLLGQPYGVTFRWDASKETWDRRQRFVLGYGEAVEAEGDDGEAEGDESPDEDHVEDERSPKALKLNADAHDAERAKLKTNAHIKQDDSAQTITPEQIARLKADGVHG